VTFGGDVSAFSVVVTEITVVDRVTGCPRRHHRTTGGLPPALHVLPPLRLVFGRFPPLPLRLGRTALAGILRRAQAHVLVRPRVGVVLGRDLGFGLAVVVVAERRVRYAVRTRQRLVDGRTAWSAGAARARAEQRQEYRQQEHAVQRAEHDDQEDHLEEHREYVTAGQHERGHAQYRADRALDDRQPERVEALPDPRLWARRLGRHVRVTYVRGEIDREADAHDQVDHRYRVQVDVPQRHVADHAQLYGHYRERDPQ